MFSVSLRVIFIHFISELLSARPTVSSVFPIKARRSVRPHLGANYLQMLSSGGKIRN